MAGACHQLRLARFLLWGLGCWIAVLPVISLGGLLYLWVLVRWWRPGSPRFLRRVCAG